MLNEELLEQNIVRSRFTVPPLLATHEGEARTPHGGTEGGLYAAGGKVYLVPIAIEGGQVRPAISQTREVTSNPTGYFKDMTFAPVDPDFMRDGLDTALRAVIRRDYARATRENRLTFA